MYALFIPVNANLNPSITGRLVERLDGSKYFASALLSLSTKPMTLKEDKTGLFQNLVSHRAISSGSFVEIRH